MSAETRTRAETIEEGAAAPAARQGRVALWLTLLLGPIVVVAALRLPLINQLNYADAWFYSGYAWVPKHHFGVYDFNYFAVRFPVILSIGVFDKAFGVHLGYLLLRYALAVGCGLALYLALRRFASRAAALGAVVLLYVNPFFSRTLLWDYAGFMLVAAGVIGVALWYWSDDRPVRWTALAGVALSTALFANALAAIVIAVLFAVEGVTAVRQGRDAILRLVQRAAVCVASGVAVFLVGWLGYVALIGHLSPWDLVSPTIKFLGDNSQNSAPYQRPVSDWLFHEPRLWTPVVLSAAAAAALGRGVLGTDVRARIVQTLGAFTAFLWLYRFAVTSSVLETWWAFNVIVVFMAPAAGVLLSELARGTDARRRTLTLVGASAAMAIAIRVAGGPTHDVYDWMTGHAAVGVVLLVGGVAVAAALAVRGRARLGVALAIVALLQVLAFAPDVLDGRGGSGIFANDARLDWDTYGAGKQLEELIRDHEGRGHQVLLWYPGNTDAVNIAWADLPQYGQTVNEVGVPETVDRLKPLGVGRLSQPFVTYVLVFSPAPSDLPAARQAMRARGFDGPVVQQGTWGDRTLSYELIELQRRPG